MVASCFLTTSACNRKRSNKTPAPTATTDQESETDHAVASEYGILVIKLLFVGASLNDSKLSNFLPTMAEESEDGAMSDENSFRNDSSQQLASTANIATMSDSQFQDSLDALLGDNVAGMTMSTTTGTATTSTPLPPLPFDSRNANVNTISEHGRELEMGPKQKSNSRSNTNASNEDETSFAGNCSRYAMQTPGMAQLQTLGDGTSSGGGTGTTNMRFPTQQQQQSFEVCQTPLAMMPPPLALPMAMPFIPPFLPVQPNASGMMVPGVGTGQPHFPQSQFIMPPMSATTTTTMMQLAAPQPLPSFVADGGATTGLLFSTLEAGPVSHQIHQLPPTKKRSRQASKTEPPLTAPPPPEVSTKEKGGDSRKRRADRNAREQQRAQQVTDQIAQLRSLLEQSGVSLSKTDKFSTLIMVEQYIRSLQSKSDQLASDHQQLLLAMKQTTEHVKNNATPAVPAPVSSSSGSGSDDATNPSSGQESDDETPPTVKGINYKGIFEFCPFAVAIASIDGRFLDCNKEFEELTRYKRDELLPMEEKSGATPSSDIESPDDTKNQKTCNMSVFNILHRNCIERLFCPMSKILQVYDDDEEDDADDDSSEPKHGDKDTIAQNVQLCKRSGRKVG